ncbi:MAG: glycerol kinase GlpK, partial [Candidatus Omnitrophica bacterium]|nr:glycerol kinase GlpK [Candidatus Omnitrophota bacterium]
MRQNVILSIDQGTTGTRAILYDSSARAIASHYQEFRQSYPKPGWVEHDSLEIWATTKQVIKKSLEKGRVASPKIRAIGITNQRETTVLWDRRTGQPVHPAIVWQDRRTTELCEVLKRHGKEKYFRERTGLVLDPYFSGTKVSWLLKTYPKLSRLARQGRMAFGTIDSWLLWNLTGGRSHASDFTNASRTLVFNIRHKKWDVDLLKILKIPQSILPEVYPSGHHFGKTHRMDSLISGIPIFSMMGDQQAALYGQGCYSAGQTKNTYGTGCFVVVNTGKKRTLTRGLLTTLACDEKGQPVYALEGSIFIAGAAMQWLRDEMKFFKKASETDRLVRTTKDHGGIVFVPAFVGLGAPYWNPRARGMMLGITRGTGRGQIIRSALESIAHQTVDVIDVMCEEAGSRIRELRVDGGATQNRFLMQ